MSYKPATFGMLAGIFAELERTSFGLKMIDILAGFFGRVSPEDARISAYLLRGKLGPDYEGLEFGIAEKLVMRSIVRIAGMDFAKIEKMFHDQGDLGSVAEDLIGGRGEGLLLKSVFGELKKIALASGSGSQETKIDSFAKLLSKSSGLEAKYIARIVLGTLRLGVAEMTFLAGLSKALTPFGKADVKENKKVLEYAFNVFSDLGEVAYRAKLGGIKALKNAKPAVGVPIRMMLAQRVEDLEEVKEHILGEVFAEYKYDGERIQAHILANGGVVLFSRRHENITNQFPDVAEAVKKSFSGKDAIAEGEVVAVDERTGKLYPFQTLMTRRRKHGVAEYAAKVPVRYFLFDLLYFDGRSLLGLPLSERKALLGKVFAEHSGISHAKYIRTEDIADVESFFRDVMEKGAEGVMIKDAASHYEAGARAWRWIKYKKEYLGELVDTFDLVVVGGIYGAGKRTGTYGSLLVAAYEPGTDKYYSFTKVGTGFTDNDLAKLPKMLAKYKLKSKHKSVETAMETDVWFEPALVMEVAGAEITVSPVHAVARDKIKKGGLALRFPRFLRWRGDKSPEQATTVKEIYELYH